VNILFKALLSVTSTPGASSYSYLSIETFTYTSSIGQDKALASNVFTIFILKG